ncbi:LytR/AlgR family response regulator transcription factor [Aurantibacillus circumpalustris]|uniref:LytR/AlgR family response regulator transcription factor n=1 Tax=Aurantibacillus circumpalustris TaxID=3036359 RepID=UPI00295B6D40|nr:response regulator [Aurantibacillus circumpalustris]
MKIKVLIVEDEVLVAEDLADFLRECGFDVSGIAINFEECFLYIDKHQPDIIIMDICLRGKLDGIEIVQILNQTIKIPFMFLTASADPSTITRALPLGPCAFLSKPFNKNDVKIALELGCQKHNKNAIQSSLASPVNTNHPVFVKDGSHYKRIDINSILYIEAKGSYSEVVTEGKSYTLSYNLNHFSDQIKNPVFKKIHRSFIVNIDRVEGFDNSSVIINKTILPISRQYHKEIMSLFQKL